MLTSGSIGSVLVLHAIHEAILKSITSHKNFEMVLHQQPTYTATVININYLCIASYCSTFYFSSDSKLESVLGAFLSS